MIYVLNPIIKIHKKHPVPKPKPYKPSPVFTFKMSGKISKAICEWQVSILG